jgi:hypothetical protein
MKKILTILLFIALASPSHAIKLCKKDGPCDWVASHPWNSDTDISGNSSSTCNPTCQTVSSGADATWTVTITNGLGRSGTISGQSRCSNDNSTNPPVADHSNGGYCWCRVTSIVDNTAGTCPADSNGAPWVFYYGSGNAANCRQYCAYRCAGNCVQFGTHYDCSRSKLLTLPTTTASAVTCPISGTCTSNSNYKTVADTASCGTGYTETTTPALTISGTYSDSKGSFTYGTCTAN